MIEQTVVLVKPDGVQRGIIGEIIKRFEQAGLKIVGMKMVWVDEDFAKKHYRKDIAERHGEWVRKANLDFLQEGPVVAMLLEGADAIATVRKIVGPTEPKAAPPGTIRGDFCHVSYAYANEQNKVIKNVVHASGDKNDADIEIPLWFSKEDIHAYTGVHDVHIL